MASGRTPSMPERVSVPDSFVFALKPIYAAYFDAQEALAADDMGGFSQAAADLRTALGFVEEGGLVGEPLGEWRRAASRLRVDPGITDIEVARVRFERMSEAVISLQRRFGHHADREWYVVHCPMAFDDQGADWLQRSKPINNPYFGASMLRCGEIRESFAPRNGTSMNGMSEPHGGGHDHE